MRIWLPAALLWLAAVARAERPPVLLLLRPEAAGPTIPLAIDDQPTWTRWPAAGRGDGLNRLYAISTGLPWRGGEGDFLFRPAGPHQWRVAALGDLKRRGFLVEQPFVPLEGESGGVGVQALALATNPREETIRSVPPNVPLSSGVTYVMEGRGWDDVERLYARGAGRILVVEFPPPPDRDWSHFWLRGRGWPEGVPSGAAPGLVRAEGLARLLVKPRSYAWTRPEPARSPRRYLEFGRGDALATLAAGAGLMVVVGLAALAQVLQERRSREVAFGTEAALLIPAGWTLTNLLGPAPWPVGLLVVGLLALLGRGLAELPKRWWGLPSLGGVFLVGALVTSAADPTYAVHSPAFAADLAGTGGWAFCVWAAYLTGLVANVAPPPSIWTWIVRGWALGLFIAASMGQGPFGEGRFTGLAVVAAVAMGERLIPPWLAISFTTLFFLGLRYADGGLVFAPLGLYYRSGDRTGINVAETLRVLATPGWYLFTLLVMGAALVGFQFLGRQLRRTFREDRRRTALPTLVACVAIVGIAYPAALSAVPMVGLIAALAVLRSAMDLG